MLTATEAYLASAVLAVVVIVEWSYLIVAIYRQGKRETRTMGLCDREFGREFHLKVQYGLPECKRIWDVFWHNDMYPHFERQLRNGNHLQIWCEANRQVRQRNGTRFPDGEYLRF